MVVVHPNNPTGSYVHIEELRSECILPGHGLAVIVDEVFLDYQRDDSGKLCGEQGCADVYVERSFENFRAAADEGGMDRDQRGGKRVETAMERLDVIADTYFR